MQGKKTRKVSHTRLPENANTMKGLNEWYKDKFEKLGWMLLAKAKGRDLKIKEYKFSLQCLLDGIEHVMKEYQDPDRIHDLRVLQMNTKVLCDFVEKHL